MQMNRSCVSVYVCGEKEAEIFFEIYQYAGL